MEARPVQARVAVASDLPRLTEIMATAFFGDPTWGWAFPDPALRDEQMRAWWGFLIEQALPQESVWITGAGEAAAVWIPPGGYECAPEDEHKIGELFTELVGPREPEVAELLERFEHAQPAEPSHHYLSLLGTHTDHRGRGIGMGLLAENLARIDAEGIPSYLESSNPANNERYERLGFEAIGEFEVPGGSVAVTPMWRDPR